MSEIWIPFLAAFCGAVIGSLTSLVTVVVQGRAARRGELTRLAIEAALADFRLSHEVLMQKGGKGAPLHSYVYFHWNVLKLLDKGELTPEALNKLGDEIDAMVVTT